MKILENHVHIKKLDAAVFDFDGTISKLRSGWEGVMEKLMTSIIPGNPDEVAETVKKYIDESTGIQTIFQMRWLDEEVQRRGGLAVDPWEYKREYNELLMVEVSRRKEALRKGLEDRRRYLVNGSYEFLSALSEKGVKLYAASGTDEEDVKLEADILGVSKFFDEIGGAGKGSDKCSKEAVLKRLIKSDSNILVVGDGKVEIALGRENNALTLGVASNDEPGNDNPDINLKKYNRLKNAGAHAIVSDFVSREEILLWI